MFGEADEAVISNVLSSNEAGSLRLQDMYGQAEMKVNLEGHSVCSATESTGTCGKFCQAPRIIRYHCAISISKRSQNDYNSVGIFLTL